MILKLVIGFERMRPHRRISVAHMRGQHDGDGWGIAELLASAFEGEAHGVWVRHAALQRIESGGL
jgi:hypothetical protein